VRIARYLRGRFGLRWTARYAVRALRARGVLFRLTRAREPKLSAARLRTLRSLLRRPPARAGLLGEQWSRARVVQLIQQRFGVQYTTQHAGRLLRALDIALPAPPNPRRLTADQAESLRTLLGKSPLALGQTRSTWNRTLIAALIQERFGVHYHSQSVPALLGRWHIALYRPPGGRARALTAEQASELTITLEQSPSQAGLPGNVWTAQRVAQLIEQRFALRYSVLGVRRALVRWGIRPLHPASRGGISHLNADQLGQLAAALAGPPTPLGYTHARWSRELVVQFLRDRFQAHYSLESTTRLLRRCGVRLRQPVSRAAAASSRVPAEVQGIPTRAPSPAATGTTTLTVDQAGLPAPTLAR
jgi:transposase